MATSISPKKISEQVILPGIFFFKKKGLFITVKSINQEDIIIINMFLYQTRVLPHM